MRPSCIPIDRSPLRAWLRGEEGQEVMVSMVTFWFDLFHRAQQ